MPKKTEYEVIYQVQFKTKVTVEEGKDIRQGESLEDALNDISVPEGEGSEYIEDTFEVLSYVKVNEEEKMDRIIVVSTWPGNGVVGSIGGFSWHETDEEGMKAAKESMLEGFTYSDSSMSVVYLVVPPEVRRQGEEGITEWITQNSLWTELPAQT